MTVVSDAVKNNLNVSKMEGEIGTLGPTHSVNSIVVIASASLFQAILHGKKEILCLRRSF